jgi:hypothetical protein
MDQGLDDGNGMLKPDPRTRSRWQRIALLLLCACAAGATAFVLVRSTASPNGRVSGPSGAQGPYVTPTLAQPFPGANEVSMSDAVSAWGGAIPLPDTPQVADSDVGKTVWLNQVPGETKSDNETFVGVTFTSQDLIIGYSRPALPDPLAYFQAIDKLGEGSTLIWLDSSTPALYTPEPPDGSDWGKIEIVAGGALIYVLGHTDKASLQAVAQSIVNRASTTG